MVFDHKKIMPLSKSIAVFIAVFITFKVYFATLTFSNMTMWYLLWYCNLAWLILALGIYTKNKTLLTLVLVTSVYEIVWYVELFAIVFSFEYNITLLNYFLEDRDWIVTINDWLSFVVHILLFPTAFYLVKHFGFDNKALWKILLFVMSLISISFFLSINNSIHLNCVTINSNCHLFDEANSHLSHLFLISMSAITGTIFSFFLLKTLFKVKWLAQ